MLRRAILATTSSRRRCRTVLGNYGNHHYEPPPPLRRGGGAVRYLNVHEYIAMETMKTYGVRTPECHVASTPDEAQHLFSNSLNKRTSAHILPKRCCDGRVCEGYGSSELLLK